MDARLAPEYIPGVGLLTARRSLRKSALWFAASLAIWGFAILVFRLREPRYEGKRLSEWLDPVPPYGGISTQQEVAVRAIGTNALPFLVDWLHSFGAKWPRKGFEFLQNHLPFDWNFESRFLDPATKPERALAGFQILGTNAAPAIPAILRLEANRRYGARNFAIQALKWIDVADERVLLKLIRNLRDPDATVRYNSAYALGSLGRGWSNTIPALLACLDDPDPMVAQAGMFAFGELGPEAKSVLPLLLVRTNINSRARCTLVIVVGQIKDEELPLEEMALFTHDPDREVRSTAMIEAHRFTNNPAAVPILVKGLRDPDERVQMMAARFLADFGTLARSAAPTLLELYVRSMSDTNDLAVDAELNRRRLNRCRSMAQTLLKIDPASAVEAGIDPREVGEMPRRKRSH